MSDMFGPHCGHRSTIADRYETTVLPSGVTERVRIPQQFRVRGDDAYWCAVCQQVVDAVDDREAAARLKIFAGHCCLTPPLGVKVLNA